MFPGAAPAVAPAAMGVHAEGESDLAGLPWFPAAQAGMSWDMAGAGGMPAIPAELPTSVGALPEAAATAPVGAVPTAVPETPATAALPVAATVIPSAGAAMPEMAVGQIPATTALPADATVTPLAGASMLEAVGQMPMGAASAEGMSDAAGVMLPSDVPNTLPAQVGPRIHPSPAFPAFEGPEGCLTTHAAQGQKPVARVNEGAALKVRDAVRPTLHCWSMCLWGIVGCSSVKACSQA
jgi:hypothetical protein